MPVRARRVNITEDGANGAAGGPEWVEKDFSQRVTIVDGQEYHWGPNHTWNHPDTGVGAAHVAFNSGTTIIEDSATMEARS